jgi:prepilin-type N-terminal cleavage/methylation domain-containing protein
LFIRYIREETAAMHHKKKGFTLIEFIIVIILLAILSTSAIIFFTDSAKFDMQVKLLASDIRNAQLLSMTHGERYRFVKLSSTSYTIQDSSSANIIMSNGDTLVSLSTGITFGALTGFTSIIVFDSRGTPYADNSTTPMTTAATISLISGSNTTILTINPETGRVLP